MVSDKFTLADIVAGFNKENNMLTLTSILNFPYDDFTGTRAALLVDEMYKRRAEFLEREKCCKIKKKANIEGVFPENTVSSSSLSKPIYNTGYLVYGINNSLEEKYMSDFLKEDDNLSVRNLFTMKVFNMDDFYQIENFFYFFNKICFGVDLKEHTEFYNETNRVYGLAKKNLEEQASKSNTIIEAFIEADNIVNCYSPGKECTIYSLPPAK